MMKTLTSGFLICAVAISFPLTAAVSPAAPPIASSSAGPPFGVGSAGERIDDAFASLSRINVDPSGAAATPSASKGDLPRLAECASAIWPNIDAPCLSTADGSPALQVRTVTISYQTGVNTTVLLRIPAAVMAQR
jgi:hypothetical protein